MAGTAGKEACCDAEPAWLVEVTRLRRQMANLEGGQTRIEESLGRVRADVGAVLRGLRGDGQSKIRNSVGARMDLSEDSHMRRRPPTSAHTTSTEEQLVAVQCEAVLHASPRSERRDATCSSMMSSDGSSKEVPPQPSAAPPQLPAEQDASELRRESQASNELKAVREEGTHLAPAVAHFIPRWNDLYIDYAAGCGPTNTSRTVSGLSFLEMEQSTSSKDIAKGSRVDLSALRIGMSQLPKPSIFPLRPDSRVRLTMDLLSMLLLFYDSLLVPYIMAWDKGIEGPLAVVNWCAIIFWTLDFLSGFVRTVNENNMIIEDYRTIAVLYLKRRFLLDLFVVATDWFIVISNMVSSDVQGSKALLLRYVRFLRSGRMLRMLAMLRTGRFAQIYELIIKRAQKVGIDWFVSFMLSLSQLMVAIFWLNHIGCCIWFAIVKSTTEYAEGGAEGGVVTTNTGRSWGHELMQVYGVTLSEQESFWYIQGLYFSISGMFSGGTLMPPSNTLETVFALCIVTFGMLFGSMLISAVAAILVEFQERSREKMKKLAALRCYLQQNKVDPVLSMNVTSQIVSRMAKTKPLSADDVPVLQLLSVEMRSALQHSLFYPMLSQHILFRIFDYVDDEAMMGICCHAVSHLSTSPGDEVFNADETVSSAFVVRWGTLLYTPPSKWHNHRSVSAAFAAAAKASENVDIPPGQWMCEAALWLQWKARGILEAVVACEVVVVDVAAVGEVLQHHLEVGTLARDYSASLCSLLTKGNVELDDRSPDLDRDRIVAQMPSESRLLISAPGLRALERSARKNPRARKCVKEIEREVHEESVFLRQDRHNKVLRVLPMVSLRLMSTDGRILVVLGEWKRSAASTPVSPGSCRPSPSVPLPVPLVSLPGLGLQPGEAYQDAFERMMRDNMPGLLPAARIEDETEYAAEEKISSRLRIRTKYATMEFSGMMAGEAAVLKYELKLGARTSSNSNLDSVPNFSRLEAFLPIAGEQAAGSGSLWLCAWMSEGDFTALKNGGEATQTMVQAWMANGPSLPESAAFCI